MERDQLDRIRTFFETHDAGDEAGHFALLGQDVHYYGSVFGREVDGIASYKGIFRSAHRDLGILAHRPRKVFGIWPDVAVLVDIEWAPPREGGVETVWQMSFGTDGKIHRLAIFWDPRGATEL